MRRLITSHLIWIYTVCHSVFDFRMQPLFASVDMSKFKDVRVHSRNSGMKGLSYNDMMCNTQKGPLCNLQTKCRLISTFIARIQNQRISKYMSTNREFQIRLQGCARSSGLSLFAYGIRAFYTCCILFDLFQV